MKIVYIADLHIGSLDALADPAKVHKRKGASVRSALFAAWNEGASGRWGSPDALIIDGDAIDGQGCKDAGVAQWETDFMEQVEHAIPVIKIWNAKQHFMLRGSEYHVAAGHTGLQVEEVLAREMAADGLNVAKYPGGGRDRSGWDWYLTFDGVTFHVAHRISLSRVFHYRSTPIARQMLNIKLNDGLRHEMSGYKTQIVVRAHAHYYWACSSSHSMGINLPCWQALTPFMRKLGSVDISPDIGFVGFECEGGEYEFEAKLWRLEDVQKPPHTIVLAGDSKGSRPRKAR